MNRSTTDINFNSMVNVNLKPLVFCMYFILYLDNYADIVAYCTATQFQITKNFVFTCC